MLSHKDKFAPLNTFQDTRIHRSSMSAVYKLTGSVKPRLHNPRSAYPIPKSQLVDLGHAIPHLVLVQPVDLRLLTISSLGNKKGEITNSSSICVTSALFGGTAPRGRRECCGSTRYWQDHQGQSDVWQY